MELTSISELYRRLNERVETVYVVPLIKFHLPKTDYLYLLYKDLLETQNQIAIRSVSVFAHFRIVIGALFSKNTILHYHWLEFQDLRSISAMPYKLFCIWMYNLLGGTTVWTIHNLIPHDRKLMKLHHSIHRWMARKAALIHVHSKEVIPEVSDFLDVPESKLAVFPHPKFPSEFMDKEEAQREFLSAFGENRTNLPSPVFLIFGSLSEYKGIKELTEVLTHFDQPFTLVIAGWIKKGQQKLNNYLFNAALHDTRVIYIPEFIPDEYYPLLLNAADVCVFNYKNILTSGGIEMARAYGKTIIAPAKGTIRSYSGEEKVCLFDSPEELRSLIEQQLNSEANA